MLCGSAAHTGGSCTVAGMNFAPPRPAARARIGYMAQKFFLYGIPPP
jgi:ABC-2 type transport system ATP-binding protein